MLKILLILFSTLVACGVTGAYVTVRFTDDARGYGPANFSEEQETRVAEYLHSMAVTCLDHPITNAFVLSTRLVSFETTPVSTPPSPRAGEDTGRIEALSRRRDSIVDRYVFDAVFQKYTYFAIPVGQIRVIGSQTVLC